VRKLSSEVKGEDCVSKLQPLYFRLPVRAQNLAISAFGVRYKRDRLGPGFERYVEVFEQRDSWSVDQMQAHVDEGLRSLLKHCLNSVPYYREVWRAQGIEEGDLARMTQADLGRLPSTPKEALRTKPEAFVADNAARRGVVRQTTSGSTGTPTTIFATRANVRQFNAVREARSFGWAGASIRLPRATVGARVIVAAGDDEGPFHRYNAGEKQVYFSALHISAANLPKYLDGFEQHRPLVLTGMAHSYFLLAQLMLQAGARLSYSPRAAILGSERLSAHMRDTIRKAFRTRVFEEYGSVENCVLATQCEHGRLHLSPDLGVLQVVDAQGHEVTPGTPGRFLCTGLLNLVQPLVRYEIGDLGTLADAGGCACGRNQFPVLAALDGRENDALVMTDGRLVATGDEIFSGVENVIEGQIVQEDLEQFTVRVVPAPGFGAREELELTEALRKRLGRVAVSVERVEELERTRSGKFRPVISRLKSRDQEIPAI
jgi:phenylacetate-CoA ligase